MQKIERYEALSRQISAQLKRGMCTNAFYSPEEYAEAIAAGDLYARGLPAGLALLWSRGDYDRLCFWLTDLDAPINIEFSRPTVLEIASRPRDMNLHRAGALWENVGFAPLFGRVRLSHPAWTPPEAEIDLAGTADVAPIQTLLQESFHPMAGCLPNRAELLRALSGGQILCLRDEAGIAAGLLHFSATQKAAKIHHLAVRRDLRRQGGARALFAAFQSLTGGIRSTVWTQADNAPALAFYQNVGYLPDGWASKVWLYKGGY